MKKIKETLLYIVLLVAMPLVFRPELIISLPILIISIAIFILLYSQPEMKFKESQTNKKTDKGTMILILVVSSFGQIISLMDWAYFKNSEEISYTFYLLGFTLMTFGLGYRIWSIRILRNAFSATVQIKENQRLIKKGPYRLIRHSSYTGAWILMVGDAIFLHSMIGTAFFLVGMLWVYSIRIKVEEEMLIKEYGQEYLNYMKSTWKMFPGW